MNSPQVVALRFGLACLLGCEVGLYYGFLRPLRPRFTVLSDLLFVPVLVWAWNALHTPRFAHDVFSTNYGQNISQLVGRPYSDGVRQSEAVRILRDTLLVNPYIKAVEQVEVAVEGSTLRLTARLKTIYGEVPIDGLDIAL